MEIKHKVRFTFQTLAFSKKKTKTIWQLKKSQNNDQL